MLSVSSSDNDSSDVDEDEDEGGEEQGGTRKVGVKHEQDVYTKRYITASQSLGHWGAEAVTLMAVSPLSTVQLTRSSPSPAV
jgi:hypothetical protein